MDIKTLSIEQLKALAYDQLVQLEQVQKNLQVINQEIASRQVIPEEDGDDAERTEK